MIVSRLKKMISDAFICLGVRKYLSSNQSLRECEKNMRVAYNQERVSLFVDAKVKHSFKSTTVYLKHGFSCESTIVVIQTLKHHLRHSKIRPEFCSRYYSHQNTLYKSHSQIHSHFSATLL